jgi:hypothetical protein
MALSEFKIPKSNLAGGASGIILGTTGYLLSRKFFENKYAQAGVAVASALVFYFIGFNVYVNVETKKKEAKTKKETETKKE